MIHSKLNINYFNDTSHKNQALYARYIHDEMYGVDLDLAGNYLLLGGSGDEYSYTATNANGDKSDIWVSYLVVADPQVHFCDLQFIQGIQQSNWKSRETLCSKESLVTKLVTALVSILALINKLERLWFTLMPIQLAEDMAS